MSIYKKAVLEVLKDGPKERSELIKQLCPKIMSVKKAQSTLNELEDEGKVKVRSKRKDGSRRWITWYVLPKHEYLLEVDMGRVVGAIERLRLILFRPPTVEEIAVETGTIPNVAEKLAYATAKEIRWFPPTPEMIEEARAKLGEVLVCSARMKECRPPNWADMYSDDPEIVREGERFLKGHPEMLPKLSEDGMQVVSWPLETLRYLGRNYQPRDRRRGVLRRAY